MSLMSNETFSDDFNNSTGSGEVNSQPSVTAADDSDDFNNTRSDDFTTDSTSEEPADPLPDDSGDFNNSTEMNDEPAKTGLDPESQEVTSSSSISQDGVGSSTGGLSKDFGFGSGLQDLLRSIQEVVGSTKPDPELSEVSSSSEELPLVPSSSSDSGSQSDPPGLNPGLNPTPGSNLSPESNYGPSSGLNFSTEISQERSEETPTIRVATDAHSDVSVEADPDGGVEDAEVTDSSHDVSVEAEPTAATLPRRKRPYRFGFLGPISRSHGNQPVARVTSAVPHPQSVDLNPLRDLFNSWYRLLDGERRLVDGERRLLDGERRRQTGRKQTGVSVAAAQSSSEETDQ